MSIIERALAKAKQQAEELLKESNKKIENAIREIRENQAEKEETKRIRQELDAFKQEMQEIDTKDNDDKIARKIAQIQQRKERHAKRQVSRVMDQKSDTRRTASERARLAKHYHAKRDH